MNLCARFPLIRCWEYCRLARYCRELALIGNLTELTLFLNRRFILAPIHIIHKESTAFHA